MFGCVAPDTTQWGKLQLYSCIVSSKQLFLTLWTEQPSDISELCQ